MATADSPVSPKKRGRVPTTAEEREKRLQNKAFDLAEKQLDSGNASSQLMTLLIKGGGVREQLELERLKRENQLLEARIESMESAGRIEERIEAAIEAFRTYAPTPPELE